MKVKDAWKLSFLLLVSCSSLQWGWKYSDSGSSFSPNPWKAQSVRRLVLKPTLLRGRKKNNPLLFSFGLFRILFGWHLFSFSVKPGRIDFSFPCPFSDWKWVRPSCNHKIPDAGPYMATEFPKCGRHYLLKFHLTVNRVEEELPKVCISSKVVSVWVWLLCCTRCPQTKSCGEAPLCNALGELLHGCSPRRERVSVVWTEGYGELSICSISASMLQESGWTCCHCVCSAGHDVQWCSSENSQV